jgi:hypothetical protein
LREGITSRAEASTVNVVFLHFVSEDTFRGVEQLGRSLTISAGRLQSILNQITLVGAYRIVQRQPGYRAGLLSSLQRCRQVMAMDYYRFANQDRPFDDVLQLTNIVKTSRFPLSLNFIPGVFAQNFKKRGGGV